MINFPFKNYAEFQELFGIQHHSNGAKSRKNRILLAYYKSKEVHRYAVSGMHPELLEITDMATLKQVVLARVKLQQFPCKYKVQLINHVFKSDIYETDDFKGVCEDGDSRCVRYIKHEDDKAKPYKMKAGKFLKAIIEETSFGQMLPEQVKVWLMEEFSMDFQTYVIGTIPSNKLFVNKEFGRIYDSKHLAGNFNSCMVDKHYHTFYKDFVEAQAAYLENEEGKIIARCIIFTNVKDADSGKIWRLAERQYSSCSNEIYKRALVDSLIKGGYIDGYKAIGAGCGDATAFVDNNGNSLADRRFYIECSADSGDVYSYQDSFKYLSTYYGEAYNYENDDYNYDLGTTYGHVGNDEDEEEEEDDPYDSYHERYCDEVATVFVDGNEETCDADDLDDFILVNGQYYHEDDVFACPVCGKKFVADDNGVYSNITDDTYCCASCCDAAEDKYKEENYYWSDYDGKWYENLDDITHFMCYNSATQEYEDQTIFVDTYYELLQSGDLIELGGVAYDEVDPFTHLPYGYELAKCKSITVFKSIAV